MQIGKIYTLTRTVDLPGRQITVCRRVKLLAVENIEYIMIQ